MKINYFDQNPTHRRKGIELGPTGIFPKQIRKTFQLFSNYALKYPNHECANLIDINAQYEVYPKVIEHRYMQLICFLNKKKLIELEVSECDSATRIPLYVIRTLQEEIDCKYQEFLQECKQDQILMESEQ